MGVLKQETTQKYFDILKDIYQEHLDGNLIYDSLKHIFSNHHATQVLDTCLTNIGFLLIRDGICKWLLEEPTIDNAITLHKYYLEYDKLSKDKKKQFIRKNRVKQTAEVFTPPWLAQQMIDKIPDEVWKDPTKTILEPSCGDGVFVKLCILKKMKFGVDIFDAIKNVYGIDIMADNIQDARRDIIENVILKWLNLKLEKGKITKEEFNTKFIELSAIVIHNIKKTKDTLKEDFDSWKSWDEETENQKDIFRNRVKTILEKNKKP